MALDRHIARLAKILVDSEGICFDAAQAKLRALTLEIVVGPDAVSPAAHAAILTAVSVASRSFLGGVCVTGAVDVPLNCALPLGAPSLIEAANLVGASSLSKRPSRKILIGTSKETIEGCVASPWWNGWRAGTSLPGEAVWDAGDNPLSGVAAATLAVASVFEAARNRTLASKLAIDLWPVKPGTTQPHFKEVLLPGALWLIGLGNLGQAFLWALAAIPYVNPANVAIVLQDFDKVAEENWSTSILVRNETYGTLKTKVAEHWALAKGFDVRRVDRRLLPTDRLDIVEPRIALSGVDKIHARKNMADVGFDGIVDVGLGRTVHDFDKYRVTTFDRNHRIDEHFAQLEDDTDDGQFQDSDAYQRLSAEIGSCGAAEILGASVAAPYVSALAATVAVSRLIAIHSGCESPANEVARLSELPERKLAPFVKTEGRGILNADRPNCLAYS